MLILATFTMTWELKAHEYGKDVNFASVYSGSVLHGNLHTRVSDTPGDARWGLRIRFVSYMRNNRARLITDPQHSFVKIPRQEFNPQLSLASQSFRAAQDRVKIREFLIRTKPHPAVLQSHRIGEYHPPRKRDDPLFRPTPSINPLAARDQPVRTVQLSRGSSPSLTQR